MKYAPLVALMAFASPSFAQTSSPSVVVEAATAEAVSYLEEGRVALPRTCAGPRRVDCKSAIEDPNAGDTSTPWARSNFATVLNKTP